LKPTLLGIRQTWQARSLTENRNPTAEKLILASFSHNFC
jgi:hypothetical protein